MHVPPRDLNAKERETHTNRINMKVTHRNKPLIDKCPVTTESTKQHFFYLQIAHKATIDSFFFRRNDVKNLNGKKKRELFLKCVL